MSLISESNACGVVCINGKVDLIRLIVDIELYFNSSVFVVYCKQVLSCIVKITGSFQNYM